MAAVPNNMPYYRWFLTTREKTLCDRLDKRLGEIINHCLLASTETTNIAHARFLLHIFEVNPGWERELTSLFLALLQSGHIGTSLQALQVLERENNLSNFFQFVFTCNREFDTVEASIERFRTSLRPRRALDAIPPPPQAAPVVNLIPYINGKERRQLSPMINAVLSLPHRGAHSAMDVQKLLEELRSMSTLYGADMFNIFCATMTQSPPSLSEVLQMVRWLNALSKETAVMEAVASFMRMALKRDFLHARQSLAHVLEVRDAERGQVGGIQNNEIRALLARFAALPFPLSQDKLEQIAEPYRTVERICMRDQNLSMEDLVAKVKAIQTKPEINEIDTLNLIAIATLALRLKFHIYLHPTQVFTVLAELLFPQGCFAQVKTGEGKSMSEALLGFVLAMKKKSVHIISSSHSLAVRDQIKFHDFFKNFGITTSSIDQQASFDQYQAMILYGTATDFEFAVMREMLYRTPLFPQPSVAISQKRFDCVIVDEGDNLTIDTALHGARLASSSEVTYDWVYGPIFRFVQEHCQREQTEFSEALLAALKTHLSEDMNGRFLSKVGDLSDEMLLKWLRSAVHALFQLEENRDYIAKKGKIEIVDYANTGRIMHGSRWSGGIHEFVEVKHGIALQKESINPLSLSHPVYYQMYHAIYGLSGTLGSHHEREEIQEIYGIDSFDVPTYKESRRIDSPPIICPSDEVHLETITENIMHCLESGRPILVLCETIRESIILHERLTLMNIPHEMLNEINENPEEEILENAGNPRAVTIATNTAGRGTDIILKGTSEQSGGLHVLLTSFSDSLRVEEQARGRAGRQGQPGSSAMILSATKLDIDPRELEAPEQLIETLYQKREQKVRSIKDYHVFQAKVDRFRFSLAQQFFQKANRFHETISDSFSNLSEALANKRILDPVMRDFLALNGRDVPIARQAFELLTGDIEETSNDVHKWMGILDQVRNRVHSSIINDWAINFYQKSEQFIDRTQLREALLLHRAFWQISPELAEEWKLRIEAAFESSLEDVRTLFNSKMEQWDKLLDASGRGLLVYLNKVINGQLLTLDPLIEELAPLWQIVMN